MAVVNAQMRAELRLDVELRNTTGSRDPQIGRGVR